MKSNDKTTNCYKIQESGKTVYWKIKTNRLAWNVVYMYANDDQIVEFTENGDKVEVGYAEQTKIFERDDILGAFSKLDIQAQEVSEEEFDKIDPDDKNVFIRYVNNIDDVRF